ncbi:EamA family transporter [Taklimakanibacter deserti]|uniref:EamA family transporter n=1 Tax=Taklimakanibacter deserti TaxID=2267839 RepID=UPI000E65BCED
MNPVLLGALAALCYGTLDFAAGSVSRSIGAIRATAAVTLFGLVLVTMTLMAFSTFPDLARNDILWPLVAGAGVALATLWLFAGIASGPVSLAVPVAMSYPATIVLLGALAGHMPTPLQLLFITIVLLGAFLVAWAEPNEAAKSDEKPDRWRRTIILALLAHATFIIAILAGQKSAVLFDELQSVWISRLAGSAVILPLLLIRPEPLRPQAGYLPVLFLMGLLDVVGTGLLFAAGKSDQPELAAVCATASGAITIVLARIFLKERIVYLRWLGIAATFLGVAALSALK